jgi:hypothetical protein
MTYTSEGLAASVLREEAAGFWETLELSIVTFHAILHRLKTL